MSQVKEPVVQEMEEKTRDFQHDKLEFIKNPTVLEFIRSLRFGISLASSYLRT